MSAPTTPFICFDNRLADAVPVASSTASGAAINLADFRPYTNWTPAALPATVTVNSGVAKSADTLGVFNHNLGSSGGTIEVHGSNSNFIPVTGGTALAATPTTLTLAAGSAVANDAYINLQAVISGSSGSAQKRNIITSRTNLLVNSTNMLGAGWQVRTGATIGGVADVLTGTAIAAAPSTLTLPSTACISPDGYAGRTATITGGTGSGQVRNITASRKNLCVYSELDSTAGRMGLARGTTPPTIAMTSFSGKNAEAITFATGVATYADSHRAGNAGLAQGDFAFTAGHYYTVQAKLALSRALIGGESIRAYVTGSAGFGNVLGIVTFTSASSSPTVQQVYADVNDNYVGGVAGSNGIFIHPNGTALTSPVTVYLTDIQSEDVTLLTNKNPSTYIHTVGAAAVGVTVDVPWVTVPDATSTFSIGGLPNQWGQNTAQTVTVGAASADDIYQTAANIPTGQAQHIGLWIKRISTTGILLIYTSVGGGNWVVDMSLLPTGWTYLTEGNAAITGSAVGAANQGGALFCASSSTIQFLFGGCELETGVPTVGQLITTGATQVVGITVDVPWSSNLLVYSQQFNSWILNGLTVTDNSMLAPDGTMTAATSTATSGTRYITVNGMVPGITYTYSQYVHPVDPTQAQALYCDSTIGVGYASIIPATGVVTGYSGITIAGSAKSQSVGGGWYRLSMSIIPTASGQGDFHIDQNQTLMGGWWGAQLEVGSVATPYVHTTGATILPPEATSAYNIVNDVTLAAASPGSDLPFVLNFTQGAYPYWRIVLNGPSAPTLSIAALGVGLPFPTGLPYGFAPLERAAFAQTNISEQGLPLGASILFEQWAQKLSFALVPNSWIRSVFLPAWKAWLRGSPFLFAYDLTNFPTEVYLVQSDGNLRVPSSTATRSTLEITVKGGAL